MAQPVQQTQPIAAKSVGQQAASFNTTGVKFTYTCPANRIAKIVGVSVSLTSGAFGTQQLRATISSTVFVLQQFTAALQASYSVYLQAGDTCDLNVSILGASGVGDILFDVEEYEAK